MIYTTACVVLMSAASYAQSDLGGVQIPDGWALDNNRNKEFLADETLVKADEIGEPGNGHIIVRAIEVDQELASFQEIVDYETKMQTLTNNRTVTITDAPKITTTNGKETATVKHVTGTADAAYQAVAFLNKDTHVVTITLASHTQAFFEDHYADFVKTVRTFGETIGINTLLTKSSLE